MWRCISTNNEGAEREPKDAPVLQSTGGRVMFEGDLEDPIITHSLE